MFEVRVKYPFGNDFVLNDKRLEAIAGPSAFSGAGFGFRDHGFYCDTFDEALDLKETIKREFPMWEVVMREGITDEPV